MTARLLFLFVYLFSLLPFYAAGQGSPSGSVDNKKIELQEATLDPLGKALEARPLRYDSVLLKQNLEQAREILVGEREYYDSTALDLLIAHPEWEGAVLVVDWTASMYQQGAQIFAWLNSLYPREIFRGIVVFNDGDGLYDDEKEIGVTGGIYKSESGHPDSLAFLLEKACLGGNGGDHRENDLEALLFATSHFPNANQFILIADNRGPIRDMQLFPLLEHNFEIVLCGVHQGNIRPDYLNLADQTEASIFMMDTTLSSISSLRKSGSIEVGEHTFLWNWKHWTKRKPQH